MGAHVWAPKFLREELLPNFRLTGWSPDWYAGFPAFTFYMIIPSLAIVMVNVGIEFSVGPLEIDSDFYAFVGLVLAVSETDPPTPARARSAHRQHGRRRGVQHRPLVALGRSTPRSRDDPPVVADRTRSPTTTHRWTSPSSGILLPAAVGSLAHHLARTKGRWRGPITALAVIACVLVVPVPYGVAMKMVAISGVVTLPLAAYAAGRLGGLAFPGPALLSVMTLPFLFDRSYNIYGGNVMSTMAGEFAFSMGLSIAVLYIGFAARGMRTGRNRVLAGGLLALAGLTHLFAAFFGLVVTLSLFLLRPGRREVSWLLVAGPIAGAALGFLGAALLLELEVPQRHGLGEGARVREGALVPQRQLRRPVVPRQRPGAPGLHRPRRDRRDHLRDPAGPASGWRSP